MKFLVDTSPKRLREMLTTEQGNALIAGQLLTPLTGYRNWGGYFAIDNGAYSGLDRNKFFRCLERNKQCIERCQFMVVPDIVGNAIRTAELYFHITKDERLRPYTQKWAYVAQDGIENQRINWDAIKFLFIGGTNNFKDSNAAYDVVKTAKALGIYVHVGRVNQWARYKIFADLGCDTCDGSGVSKYDRKLIDIFRELYGRLPNNEKNCAYLPQIFNPNLYYPSVTTDKYGFPLA